MLVLCLGAALAASTSCRKGGEAAKTELKERGYELSPEEFFRAAESDDVQALEQLLKGGIAVDTRNAEGDSALHAAAVANMKKSVDFLLEHGVPVDVAGAGGRTPLMATVLKGQPVMARYLLSKKADPQKKDAEGYTPLSLAVTSGQPGMVAELAAYERNNLDSALLMAALEGRASAIDELTQYGASVYARMEDGRTALMVAAENGNVEAVAMLLNLGANRFAMNEDGRIAADFARDAGHGELAKLLTEQPKQDEFGFEETSDLGAEMMALMAAADAKAGMTGEVKDVVTPPPGKKAEDLPWNRPVPGQGGGAFGSLPSEPRGSAELEGAVLATTAPASPEKAGGPAKPQPFVMRLYRQKELPLRVESVEGEVATLRMAGGGTSQVNTGATVPGSRLKLLRVGTRVQHIKDAAQDEQQVAVASLEDTATGQTREVISGLSTPSHDPVALVEDATGKRYVARAGQKFRTAAGEDFTVIDVRPNQMVVENHTKGEVITVPLRGPRG